MKQIFTLVALIVSCILSTGSDAQAQVVFIPDANFKAALVDNPNINTNGDSEIQTSEATAYKGTLSVGGLQIADLTGVQAFVNIPRLYCNNNNLTSIDVSANVKLTALRCNHNQLTSLDVSNLTALTDLRCYVNSIDMLDLSANTELTTLMAWYNGMTNLGISANAKLSRLEASFNDFEMLDLRPNTGLTYVDLRGITMTHFNIRNGHNTAITYFNTTNSHDLVCVTVDDPAYSEANWNNVDYFTHFSADCEAEDNDIVYIPDPNFKNALLELDYININGDDEIQRLEAEGFGGSLYMARKGIADLTGVEAFINIRELHVQINNLTAIDVSHNTKLVELLCEKNQLTSLDVSALPDLGALDMFRNHITQLDLSHNPKLTRLEAYENEITTLDVSANPALRWLEVDNNHMTSLILGSHPGLTTLICDNNELTSLDLSGLPMLTGLEAQVNKLTSIDVSANPELATLRVGDNMLSSLDVSANTKLGYLQCYNNKITSLDLRGNPSLFIVDAYLNKLTSMNVKNGNNRRIYHFTANRNPDLTCIEVDDPRYSELSWPDVDAQTVFSYDCSNTPRDPNIVFIPDPRLKAALVGNPEVNTNGDSEIQVTEARAVTTVLELTQLGILDPTGLEAFTRVRGIYIGKNSLVWLDVRNNVELVTLDGGLNQLRELQINNNLDMLLLVGNQLTGIDYGANNRLRTVDLRNNQFTSFDSRLYGFGSTMRALYMSDNFGLSFLDVSNFPGLVELWMNRSQVEELDLSQNPNMGRALVDRNFRLKFINIKSGNTASYFDFNATNCSELVCIEVDDVAYVQSRPTQFKKPSHTNWSTDCDGSGSAAAQMTIAISPNPTSGRLTIESEVPVEQVQIYDGISGNLVNVAEGKDLDISGMPNGVYLLKVSRGGVLTTMRIVKN
jgi:hypothetical protein